jgi:hypothetical protein
MTNTIVKLTFSKEDVINFTLRCLSMGIGRYSLNELDLPARYKEKGILSGPEGVKIGFFEDVNLLLETTKKVRDTEQAALSLIIEMLDTLGFLELGTPAFRQDHLRLLRPLRSIRSLQKRITNTMAWRLWLIDLVQKVDIEDLSNEELRDIASAPICFASESFFFAFDRDGSSTEVAPFVRFVFKAIQRDVYPWTFDPK